MQDFVIAVNLFATYTLPSISNPNNRGSTVNVDIVGGLTTKFIQYYPTLLSFTFYPMSSSYIGTHTVEVVVVDDINSVLKNTYYFTVKVVAPPKTGDDNTTETGGPKYTNGSEGVYQVNSLDYYIEYLNKM